MNRLFPEPDPSELLADRKHTIKQNDDGHWTVTVPYPEHGYTRSCRNLDRATAIKDATAPLRGQA